MTNILGNNFVSSLMEEGEDLWIGTSSGLYIYDRSDDHFLYFDKTTKYGVFISCEVKKIVKTKNGLIWIATLGQGIFIYDPVKDVLTQNSIRTFFAWDICQGTDSLVYVSSMQEGLLCFDEQGTFLQSYPVSFELNIGNQRINSLQTYYIFLIPDFLPDSTLTNSSPHRTKFHDQYYGDS